MTGFVKLYGSILDSTIWGESHATRIVWITMLALADADGNVESSLPGLAHRARVTVDECRSALTVFLAPDPDSATKLHEGRRIEVIPRGWRILNARYFRERGQQSSRTTPGAPGHPREHGYRGYIYAVRRADGTGAIKLGYSANPWARLRELETGAGQPLVVIKAWRGTREDETRAHLRFKHLRQVGEWFEAAEELTAWLDTLTGDQEPRGYRSTTEHYDRSEAEAEAEAEADQEPPQLPLVPDEPMVDPLGELVDHVMRELILACRQLRGNARGGPDPTCDRTRSLIVKLAKTKPKVKGADDPAVWSLVIRRQLASVQHQPHNWKYLSLATLTRPANFIRLRDQNDGGPQRTGTRPWSPGNWDEEP